MSIEISTPCREWRGYQSDGYGIVRLGGKRHRLHRWIVAQIDGWDAIRDKMVLHHCNNRICFRYDHLYIGTHADNMADMARNGTHRNRVKTHCPAGHPYDETNTHISPLGRRRCRTCRSQQSAEQYADLLETRRLNKEAK